MTHQDNSSDLTDEPFEDEIFEKEDLLLGGKGMKPMSKANMINVLYKLRSTHPEIIRLRDVSERQWQQIAQEFGIDPGVMTKSATVLKDTSFRGYDEVRDEQARLGL